MENYLPRSSKWSEETKLEALTQIVDVNLQYLIGSANTSEEILHKLLKLKYNHNTVYKYQSKLASIKQHKYYTIKAYLKEIEITTHKI